MSTGGGDFMGMLGGAGGGELMGMVPQLMRTANVGGAFSASPCDSDRVNATIAPFVEL